MKDVVKNEARHKEMGDEIVAIKRNETWEIVILILKTSHWSEMGVQIKVCSSWIPKEEKNKVIGKGI